MGSRGASDGDDSGVEKPAVMCDEEVRVSGGASVSMEEYLPYLPYIENANT